MTTSRQYDALNRLTQISSTPSGAGLLDGWNPAAETAPDNSLIRNYVWGTDLSGSAQDAAGVGGLLEVSYHGATLTNAFAAYDGNGNVIALVNAANGAVVPSYEYGPFGEVIRATGPMAKNNPLRFSTKYQDDESDLLYYGYRYYKPSTGTRPNRDPLGESAFFSSYSKNMDPDAIDQLALCALQPTYCFVGNNSINKIDYLGNVIVDGSTHTIYVFNCEIVILYGHGRKSNPWKWKFIDADSNAGAAIMCWPVSNSTGIPQDRNLFTSWGGEPLDDVLGDWAFRVDGPDFCPAYPGPINDNKALDSVVTAARVRARAILAGGTSCCKRVNIIYVQVGKDGNQIDPTKATGGMPAMKNETITAP